ncbi:hypothetical protein BC938DRAFT_482013 [Jimgerdemannia flammicorona]|uniref:THIF-type NAD/FAD binding fold domain-containing protein n=1 Tax=Jimgerdemannia flammicorona TaxID=994334 RepID=A0A433QEW5_9FUNG|nr:hypothetical protein BC938DRAFT_482013 [Jimgerdemannia flammicorona]
MGPTTRSKARAGHHHKKTTPPPPLRKRIRKPRNMPESQAQITEGKLLVSSCPFAIYHIHITHLHHHLPRSLADEAALYDRQIRLWGLEAQQRMRNSNILVAGMRALSNEVCKNLVLAGVGAVTILDHAIVSQEDLGAQFFLAAVDVGKNRAKAAAERVRLLNPRVTVTADTGHITSKPDDFFAQFDVVCLTDSDLRSLVGRPLLLLCTTFPVYLYTPSLPPSQLRVDVLCRANEKAFYAAGTMGSLGYIFCDVGRHTYIE